MKKFKLLSVLAVAAFLFVCASSAAAQKVGGYRETSKTDQDVVAAADFAVSARADKTGATIELQSIEHAERQVVAGTNFRFCLKVSASGDGDDTQTMKTVKAVVYRNLKGEFSLTSWVKEECGGK
jgi:Aspartic acid proteinase inhibitor